MRNTFTIEHHTNSHWGLRDSRNELVFKEVQVRYSEAGAIRLAKKLTGRGEVERRGRTTIVGNDPSVCYIRKHP